MLSTCARSSNELQFMGMFTHVRSGRGRICHFLRTMMVWSMRFQSRCEKLAVGPICCRADFAPAPPPCVWTHVMICVEANFLLASACVRSALVWTYLKSDALFQYKDHFFRYGESHGSKTASLYCDGPEGYQYIWPVLNQKWANRVSSSMKDDFYNLCYFNVKKW